jgi:rhodanese-related sulfurtransferase
MNELYLTVYDLFAHIAGGTPLTIVDVRGEEEYAAGHIPRALHIPGDRLADRLDEIPRDRLVVAY